MSIPAPKHQYFRLRARKRSPIEDLRSTESGRSVGLGWRGTNPPDSPFRFDPKREYTGYAAIIVNHEIRLVVNWRGME